MKRAAIFAISLILSILVLSFSAYSVVIEVPDDYPNIQAGIDAAESDDTVLIHDGIYSGDGNRDLDFGGRLIVLMSENGPEFTIIAAGGTSSDRHRAFCFTNGEDSTAVVNGFQIKGGTHHNGAGVLIENASPTFENCVFHDNFNIPVGGLGYGGGISLTNSSSIIRDCLFDNNRSVTGAGIYAAHGEPTVEDCVFRDNIVQPTDYPAYAAGIYLDQSDAEVRSCLFMNNFAQMGTAMTVYGASPDITYCTFARNTGSAEGSVIKCIGGPDPAEPFFGNCIIAFNDQCRAIDCLDGPSSADPVISCCDIYGNTLGSWVGCIEPFADINGNLFVNPLFCDMQARDLHLAKNSQCAPENNLCSDQIGALGVGCDGIGTEIVPNLMYVYYIYSMEPRYADIYIYDAIPGYTLNDIDTASVVINGGLHPIAFEYIAEADSTQEALRMTIDQRDFILGYMPFWESDMMVYNMLLSYDKGSYLPPAMVGWFNLIGHRSGDFNIDGSINLLDITFLIRYLYKNGQAPVPELLAADIDGSGNVNILDAIYLVNYLFKNGPSPEDP